MNLDEIEEEWEEIQQSQTSSPAPDAKPKAKAVKEASKKAKTRKLDSIPRTGERAEKSTAGLVGAVAMALYFYSRKIRED